jgi:hypothetical protein
MVMQINTVTVDNSEPSMQRQKAGKLKKRKFSAWPATPQNAVQSSEERSFLKLAESAFSEWNSTADSEVLLDL